ncbi:biotin--[acetyl-CoA-carboxylase] ligase [Dongia deserti]|uniref:biotin--[acetyl-CoA-carboxylase] ligase n=1 Tax=Dongia deserti TaxID=2268030 RepID=UPI000E649547|nr:biotin--[acetyl-CoA-carboxylase] ligase [Dongia deserti]
MSFAFRIEQVAEIDSTNEACRLRALTGEAAGLVIRADRQTSGRGRRGRSWTSPAGNLHASLLLRPARPIAEVAALGFAAVTAMGDVAEALLPADTLVQHKWPNDLLINVRKASGTLLEAQQGFVVIGVGVNIVGHPEDTPYPATDLVAEGAPPISAQSLLERLLAAFAPLHDVWEADGFSAVLPAWRRRAAGLGGTIEVRLERETLTGIFQDLEPDGTLRLVLADGTERRIAAGDVYFPALRKD